VCFLGARQPSGQQPEALMLSARTRLLNIIFSSGRWTISTSLQAFSLSLSGRRRRRRVLNVYFIWRRIHSQVALAFPGYSNFLGCLLWNNTPWVRNVFCWGIRPSQVASVRKKLWEQIYANINFAPTDEHEF
jgi:hypothetical protein